jgi:iron complex transport system substrate-binding protein
MFKPAKLAALCLSAALISACGSTTNHPSRPAKPTTVGHRVPLSGTNGVPLPATADRIISLTDASTEDLFAIGAGRQVVAVDEYSTYPPNAPRTRLSAFTPNVEAIAKYRPDLVVTSQNVDHIESQLAALHIPVLYEGAPANNDGAYTQIQQLGDVSGHAARAAALVSELQRRVNSIVASVKRENPPLTVYHELDQTYYSASSKTFIGQLYTLLGLKNIADKAAKASVYPQLSDEYIVAASPGLIVLADTVCCGQTAKTVAARPGWSNITAVKDNHILAVNDTIASEWGPRIVDFLAQVAAEVRKIEAQK